ncbi:MAG: S9 family peptidase, partial [Nannocystaceae bacterium]
MTPTHPRTLRSRRAGPWLAAAALSLACQAPPRARDEAGPEDKPATPAADPAKAADEPASLSPIAPAGPHAFSVLDLLEMDRLSEPRVSHDGAQVVYTLRETDLVGNKARRSLWVVALAGGEPRPLETAANGQPADGSDPRWSGDGAHVYFVSKRSGSPQVWRAPITGGAATQVTALPVDVSGLKLSPRGDRLLVTAELFPDCDTLACTKQRLDARADDKVTGVRYEQLFVRHWDTWKDGRRAALLLAPTDGAAPVGDATILTRGLLADVPSKPFGGSEEYAFSPDGAHVVFTARRGDAREPWSTNFDLYRVAVDGDEPPQNLTEANLAWDTHPLFSADGRSLFYLAMARPGYEADRFRVVQQAFPMGERRVIAEGWDRSVSDMILAPDGASLYVVAQDLGHTPLFRVTL